MYPEDSNLHIRQRHRPPTIPVDGATERPASAPLVDRSVARLASGGVDVHQPPRVASDSIMAVTGNQVVAPLDLVGNLKRAEPSIVKTRTGSVLSRGFILKTDYYPSGSLDYY
jgi:hypothetical protein